ncbi:hypothetical protein BGW80DRAFT_1290785 [Lactifluus volemus]|nr:hypothetical protein BGW80DRAFT_1290785 [Lactifluus volemus]
MDQETHRRRLIIFAAALAAIGATYAAVLVAQEEEMDKAIWCPRETAVLVDYLHQRSFEVGNGGNFKNGTFNEAAGVIEPFLEAGVDKAGMHCKTRWEKIKTIYAAIRKYQNIPGTHWDNENGAGIEGSSAAAVWDSYVSQKKLWLGVLR